MIIVLTREATEQDAQKILGKIESAGLKPLYMPGVERIVLGALGDERGLAGLNIAAMPFVESVKPILASYKQVEAGEMQAHDTSSSLRSTSDWRWNLCCNRRTLRHRKFPTNGKNGGHSQTIRRYRS
ncbi:MAG: hypothetical protein Q9M92_10155 [Enterobacterales bacterium]|nr:hypothetical protein [Enterobacterales bacterium]